MEIMIGHGHGFLKTFGLIVYAAGADGIDISPVFFRLGMNLRVTVYFGGGGDQHPCLFGLCESQAVMGAKGAYFQCLNGYFQVVYRAGRGCKMKDIFQFTRDMDKLTDIMVIEFEIFQFEEVFYISQVAGNEIVHTDDMVAFFDEPVA